MSVADHELARPVLFAQPSRHLRNNSQFMGVAVFDQALEPRGHECRFDGDQTYIDIFGYLECSSLTVTIKTQEPGWAFYVRLGWLEVASECINLLRLRMRMDIPSCLAEIGTAPCHVHCRGLALLKRRH